MRKPGTRAIVLHLTCGCTVLAGVVACSSARAQAVITDSATPEKVTPADGAPAATAPQVSDIVVTATRRATNVQNVPIAITAISGSALAAQGITDITAITRAMPNIFATTGFSDGNLRFSIRGLASNDISSAGGSPVGIYVDDVYQTYNFGIGSQIYDLDRVEVLRGPQGTLFGKNTTAGAISYFSAAPNDQEEGYVNADGMWGAFGKYQLEAMYNMPLSENLSARFDVRYDHRDNFVDNVYNGRRLGRTNNVSGRFQIRWNASPSTRVDLKVFGQYDKGAATLYHGRFLTNVCDPAGFDPSITPYAHCSGSNLPPVYTGYHETADETPSIEKYHNYGETLRVNQDLGNDWHLTSITAHEAVDYALQTNDDGNSIDLFHTYQPLKAWQVSQEVRIASPAAQPLSAIIGLFGQYDHAYNVSSGASTEEGPPLDYLLRADARQNTKTFAVFTSTTWKIDDKLSLVGGLRYSRESRKVRLAGIDLFSGVQDLNEENTRNFDPENPPFALSPGDTLFSQRENRTWSRLTWDATASYRLSSEFFAYVKAAQGFRSGGYNLAAATGDTVSTVDPEILTSYEAGVKLDLLDRRLRINASGFHYILKNQQIQSTGAQNAAITLLTNAGRSTLNGFELEGEFVPVRPLHLNASVGFTASRFDRFDTLLGTRQVSLAGNLLPGAPRWTTTGSADYDIPLAADYVIRFHADANYRSQVYFNPYNFAFVGDGPLLLGNARVTLTSPAGGRQWHVAAYVNNLTNRNYVTDGFSAGAESTSYVSSVYGDKRQWGVQFGFRF